MPLSTITITAGYIIDFRMRGRRTVGKVCVVFAQYCFVELHHLDAGL